MNFVTRTRNSISLIFFLAVYSSYILHVGGACNVTITNSSGTFSSGYPTLYEPNLNCEWNFQAPEGKVIEITFDHVELEEEDSEGNCPDSITIYDPTINTDFQPAVFCGDGPGWPRHPTRYMSTTTRLTVQMTTNSNANYSGFSASYMQVAPRTEYIAAVGADVASIVRFNRFSTKGLPRIPLPRASRPSGLSFDPVTEYFYYTDTEEKFIGRVKITEDAFDILVEDNLDTPFGIAVAYITGLLYWTDIGRNEVSVSRLDGTSRKLISLPDSGCEVPRAVSLSLDHRFVLWTCKYSIQKSWADGSDLVTLVDGLNDVRTLAVDPYVDVLYWINVLGTFERLERINLNGTFRDVVYTASDVFAPFHGFTMDEFTFFWSHPSDRRIYHVERGKEILASLFIANNPPQLEGLYYYKSDQDIAAQHQCAIDNGHCNDLCIPDESSGVLCIEVKPMVVNCPDDIRISTDGPRIITWDEPTAVSRSHGNTQMNLPAMSRSHAPGSYFYLGTSTIIYVFSDGMGNEANCTFIIDLFRPPTTVAATQITKRDYTTTTTLTTLTTTVSKTFTNSKNRGGIFGEYLPYTITVIAVLVVSLIVTVLVVFACVAGYCTCSRQPQSRKAVPDLKTMVSVPRGNNLPLHNYDRSMNTYQHEESPYYCTVLHPAP